MYALYIIISNSPLVKRAQQNKEFSNFSTKTYVKTDK